MEGYKIEEAFENFNLCIEGLQREVNKLRDFSDNQDKRIIYLEKWVKNRRSNEKRMLDEIKLKQKWRKEQAT